MARSTANWRLPYYRVAGMSCEHCANAAALEEAGDYRISDEPHPASS
jgi:hypothetical protein